MSTTTATRPEAPQYCATGAPAARGGMALPVAMVLGSCLSLQFGAAFATRLFPVLGALGVTTLRLGLAALVMLPFARPAVLRWNAAQWRAVGLFGLAFAGMNGFFYSSIARIPIGPAVAIEFLGPLVMAAVGSRRRVELGCAAVALLGVSLFGLDDLRGALHLDPVGVVFALVAGVFWAGYVVASQHTGEVVEGRGGLVAAMAIGSLVLLPVGGGPALHALAHPHLVGLALGCALLASVIPYTLELAALRRLPRNVFGVLLSLEPAVAAVAGLALLGQPVTVLGAIAILLVVAASAGSTLLSAPTAQQA